VFFVPGSTFEVVAIEVSPLGRTFYRRSRHRFNLEGRFRLAGSRAKLHKLEEAACATVTLHSSLKICRIRS